MKDMTTKNLFEVPSELPEEAPTICPCFAVSKFQCPAKKSGRVLENCVGKAFLSCSNFSAWWFYKLAEITAKLNKPNE